MEEIIVELNKLIDMPIEDAINFLNGFTLGQLKCISNGIKLKYSEVELLKDQILNFKQLKDVTKEDLEKANELVKNLYIALQKIEDINNITNELIEVRVNQC